MATHTGTEILQAASEGAQEARLLALEKQYKEITLRLVALEVLEKERNIAEERDRAQGINTAINQHEEGGSTLTSEILEELSGEFSHEKIKEMYAKMQVFYRKKGKKVPYGWLLTKKLREWLERERAGF